jgi:hypothetical protein
LLRLTKSYPPQLRSSGRKILLFIFNYPVITRVP